MRMFPLLRFSSNRSKRGPGSPVPPIAHLSSVIPADGTTIVLTYSLPVVIGAGGSGGHTLTLSGGPVTMTYSSGTGTASLTYSLSRTAAGGETGTISYAQPVSGVEEAVYRVDVDSFTGRAITNNSTAVPPPNLVSATIGSTGTSISLLYSAAVRIGTSGAGGHTLTMLGGAATMTYTSGGDTSTLTYNLSRAVSAGETGTLAFVQPSNGIESLATGADVVSFSGAAVTNNSTAAPVLLTAAIASSGAAIAMTYTTPMEFGAGGSSGHTLTASGGASTLSSPTGVGTTTLTYALSRTLIASETVTLAYTQPGDGAQAVAGAKPDLATFSGRAVTNGSTQAAPTQTSASINSAGTQLSIAFSQSVTFGAGGNGGHALTMSGGVSTLTYASGSGTSTLVYTMSRTVNSGETGTLAYTQPGSGVESLASLADVATYSGRAVTNNSTAGSVSDPTWVSTPPTITFTQGSASSRDLTTYTGNFNPTLHEMQMAEGSNALPTGVTLNPTGSLSYNGTAPTATVVNVQVDLEDKALTQPQYAQVVEDDGISWLNASGGLYMPWLNGGGDWRDANNAQNGTAAYANGTITDFGAVTLSFDVTALATRLLTNNTGIHVRRATAGDGPCDISSRTGSQAPTLQIVTNTGTFNCPCLVSFQIAPSSGASVLGADIQPTVLLKFDLSAVTGTVSSATMTLRVTNVYPGVFPRNLAANYLDMPRLYYNLASEVGGVVQGIAGTVTQDNQLGAHPSVLLYDDLTSDAKFYGTSRRFVTVNLGPGGRSYEALPQYGLTACVVTSTTTSPHIVDVHRWSQPMDAEPEPNAAWRRPYTVGQELGHTHLFFRYLMWIGEDLYAGFNELGMKLSSMAGSYDWSTSGANTQPAPRGDAKLHYRSWHSKDSTAAPHFYTFGTYEYDPDWTTGDHPGVGRTRMANTVRGAALRAGRWYCFEQELQLNTLTGLGLDNPNGLGLANVNPDGIERWWIDGVLTYEYTNLRMRGTPEVNLQSIPYLTIYHGGITPPSAPFTYKLAGVCVSSQYIGPPKVIA